MPYTPQRQQPTTPGLGLIDRALWLFGSSIQVQRKHLLQAFSQMLADQREKPERYPDKSELEKCEVVVHANYLVNELTPYLLKTVWDETPPRDPDTKAPTLRWTFPVVVFWVVMGLLLASHLVAIFWMRAR